MIGKKVSFTVAHSANIFMGTVVGEYRHANGSEFWRVRVMQYGTPINHFVSKLSPVLKVE
jgi:hypothetical protein